MLPDGVFCFKIKLTADEGLTCLASFDLAMEPGWSGTAAKTCRGRTHSLLCLARAVERGVPYSVQDLSNPSIALIHSVGLAARTNSLTAVEANARRFLPSSSSPEAGLHPGLFDVRDGVAWTASVGNSGPGYRIIWQRWYRVAGKTRR